MGGEEGETCGEGWRVEMRGWDHVDVADFWF